MKIHGFNIKMQPEVTIWSNCESSNMINSLPKLPIEKQWKGA